MSEADSDHRRPRGEVSLELIVQAARERFQQHGVSATRMEHIAQHARLSRQHLYTFVGSRTELLELAALARLRELGDELEARAQSLHGDVGEAFVDQILATTAAGRNDPEFITLAEAMPRFMLNRLLTSRSSPMHEINSRVFGPLISRAVAEKRLRSDVSIDAIVGWLQGVLAMLAGLEDVDDAHQRETVRQFVVPSVLRT